VCYVAHLSRTLAPVSVGIYLNVVRILHEECGFVNPLKDNYELMLIKRGLKRVKGCPVKQKAPITVDLLIKMFVFVDISIPSEKAFWCAMLVGFYGFLRKSSLVPESVHTPSDKRLNRSDVSLLCLDSFVLTCRHSKTIQYGQRVHVIPYSACVDKRICPVFALLSHVGASVLAAGAPLFDYVQAGVATSFTHASLVVRLKLGIEQCGLDPKQVSCHSLRRGGALLAFASHLSADSIKQRGDWASNCYRKYLVVSQNDSFESARVLSASAAARASLL
jgi:hypothetical protein